jgi:hypothetical protein
MRPDCAARWNAGTAVGQMFSAVPNGLGWAKVDNQERLSYQAHLPTPSEAHCLPAESGCATLAVSKSPMVQAQERIVES